MAPALLGNVQLPNLISRHDQLATAVEVVIDGTISPSGTSIPRGCLLGLVVATGKYRPYAESFVLTTAVTTSSPNVQLDPAQVNFPNFQVGDVLEDSSGNSVGTIQSINATSGLVVLTANSAHAVAVGVAIRISDATVQLSANAGRILEDEVLMSGTDAAAAAYSEGFFTYSITTFTAAAQAKMLARTVTTNEIRVHA